METTDNIGACCPSATCPSDSRRSSSTPSVVNARRHSMPAEAGSAGPSRSSTLESGVSVDSFNSRSSKRCVSRTRNFIKENARSAAEHGTQRRRPIIDSAVPRRHGSYGQIPEYLSQIKSNLEEKRRRELEESEARALPPGTRRLSSEERLSLIERLKTEQREAEHELARMPIAVKTQSQRTRIEFLERKLQELQRQQEKLSRPNLLVEI